MIVELIHNAFLIYALFSAKEANGESTYAIPRDNGEVTLGGTYVSLIFYRLHN